MVRLYFGVYISLVSWKDTSIGVLNGRKGRKEYKMSNGLPDKPPETMGEKLDVLYAFVCNHMNHRVKWLDIQQKFILVFLALILGLLGIIVSNLAW